jgi:hypothetical protein
VDEAVALLAEHGDDGKLIAGGHSLLPVMKLRFSQPAHLIDIRRVPELAGIREENGTLRIGATTTHAVVASSDVIRYRAPMLAEAAGRIGDAQIRNMGTIGGSLAHADPAADLPAVMLALGAELHAVGPRGARPIPVDRFFVGLFSTALAATYMTKFEGASAPGGANVDRLSRANLDGIFAPRLKGTASIGWSPRDELKLSLAGRYVGEYRDYTTTRTLGEHWYLDAAVEVGLLPNLRVFLTGTNLADKLPPYATHFRGYDIYNYELIGRTIFLRVQIRT